MSYIQYLNKKHIDKPAGQEALEQPLKYFANAQVDSDGWGTLGLGDRNHGISLSSVKHASESVPAFVKTYSYAWRTRYESQVSASTERASTTHKCCFEQRGFCRSRIDKCYAKYQQVIDLFTWVAQNHRKSHLIKGKNQGPSHTIPHPLLISFQRTVVV